MLLNAFTFREIQLRGLISTGRSAEAAHLLHAERPDGTPAAPQWHIIERVTAGQVHLAVGQRAEAEEALRTALNAAETHQMPHQIQRAIRAADEGCLTDLSADGKAALQRLIATSSLGESP